MFSLNSTPATHATTRHGGKAMVLYPPRMPIVAGGCVGIPDTDAPPASIFHPFPLNRANDFAENLADSFECASSLRHLPNYGDEPCATLSEKPIFTPENFREAA